MNTKSLTLLPFICIFALLFVSCNGKRKEKAKQVVSQFHQAFKSEDVQETLKLYPNISVLKGDFFKTDELEIKGACVLPEKDVLVIAENKWTNGFGQKNTRLMKFFVREFEENGEKIYKIYDTKNFVDITDTRLYRIGLKGGAINLSSDSTDVSISRKLRDIEPQYRAMINSMRDIIYNGISYTGFNWKKGYYCDYAYGSCSVLNNSGVPIKNPRYKITYYKSDNETIVATDDGTICYGWWYPGETKRVSWYTSNVPSSARYATIDLVLDYNDDWIEEVIEAQSFSGTEFKK
jgi:hypothetical protein